MRKTSFSWPRSVDAWSGDTPVCPAKTGLTTMRRAEPRSPIDLPALAPAPRSRLSSRRGRRSQPLQFDAFGPPLNGRLSISSSRAPSGIIERRRNLAFSFGKQVEIRDRSSRECRVDRLAAPFVHVEDVGCPHAVARAHRMALPGEVLRPGRGGGGDTRPSHPDHLQREITASGRAATDECPGFDRCYRRASHSSSTDTSHQPCLCQRPARHRLRDRSVAVMLRIIGPLRQLAAVDVCETNLHRVLWKPQRPTVENSGATRYRAFATWSGKSVLNRPAPRRHGGIGTERRRSCDADEWRKQEEDRGASQGLVSKAWLAWPSATAGCWTSSNCQRPLWLSRALCSTTA